ncbi:MAG: hypothetical protein ABR525_05585 [Candidatus Limnocylindria bacterium]
MRRLATSTLAALLLIVGPLAVTSAAVDDVKHPACANITGSSQQSYYKVDDQANPPGEAILSLQITTTAPLCDFATLTVFLSTDGVTFTPYTYPSSYFTSCGPNCLTFTYDYGSTTTTSSTAPATVYVYLQTDIHGHVVDRAPNDLFGAFALCDAVPLTTNYDLAGSVPSCGGGGGEFFE